MASVSHRFAPVTKKAADTRSAKAASCTLDSMCRPEYAEPASAIALMVFESDGGSYQCSGSLLSSASQPLKPFFLTANHCISTAAEAKSLITFFNYQTTACNGTVPTLSRSPRVTGATLLATGAMALGDYTLLQLSGFPSVDVKLLGWTSNDIASNEQVVSISHPSGDYKRIAFGRRTRDAAIRFGDGSRMPANRGYQVTWFEGVTQGGSSGSPLFAEIDGKPYVVGTLTGGPDIDDTDEALVCRTSNLIASYGRFNVAFPDFQSYLTTVDGGSRNAPAAVAPSLIATPLMNSGALGVTTLTWQASGFSRVQIRVGSADGPAMTGLEGPSGTVQTGVWASEGMEFYLQDARDGNSAGPARTLATVRVQRASTAAQSASGILTLTPSRIVARAGQNTGIGTITWRATGVSRVQVRVGSPTGTPMTGIENVQGSATTGNWVTNGMVFFLQDASTGDSSGASRTLASIRAEVISR
jgi:V8-like Glu-specific endopeptidase